jgi:hypothetical protein
LLLHDKPLALWDQCASGYAHVFAYCLNPGCHHNAVLDEPSVRRNDLQRSDAAHGGEFKQMRLTFFTVCMIMLYNGFPEAARAQDYPWCVVSRDRTDCSFTTYEQCQATASGYGGCSRNKRTLWSNGAMPPPVPSPSSTRRPRRAQ